MMMAPKHRRVVRAMPCLLAVCLLALSVYAKYSGGSGTAQDPYQIATAADLMALGETPVDGDRHFILTTDIDMDPKLPGRKIFDKAVICAFDGVFEGSGHVISHLTIRGSEFLGLFGQLGLSASRAEVRNLGVVDVNITGSGGRVGGLVGDNGGAVTQCYSTGAVKGDSHAGGLVGSRNSNRNVIACFWDTQTSGQAKSAGGIGKTTPQMKTARTFRDAGWDFVGETANGTKDIWRIDEGKDYPRLWWEATKK